MSLGSDSAPKVSEYTVEGPVRDLVSRKGFGQYDNSRARTCADVDLSEKDTGTQEAAHGPWEAVGR